jgi:integrase
MCRTCVERIMKNKLNFTVSNLTNIPIPESVSRSCYYDQKTPGLAIMVFPSGTKTFFLYKRVNGKPDKIKLGRFPELSIEQARKAAIAGMNDIANGLDPNKEKQKIRDELNFGKLFATYMEEHAKIRKKSWETDLGYYNRYLQSLASRKISSITRSDIEKLHNNIKNKGGLYAANRVLSLIKTIFNKAIDWGFDGNNPASRIKKFTETSRDRALQPHELEAFFEALNLEPNTIFRAYFFICLLTGARRRNAQAMRWDQVIFGEYPEWRIPITKNGDVQIVSLVPQAVTILLELKNLYDSEWVFPSILSKSGHIEEPKNIWKKILQQANIKDLRIHDLRRTMASWQVRTGANSFVIGKTLGHKSHQATAIYARVSKDVARESMENAVNAMFEHNIN